MWPPSGDLAALALVHVCFRASELGTQGFQSRPALPLGWGLPISGVPSWGHQWGWEKLEGVHHEGLHGQAMGQGSCLLTSP